MRKIIKKVILTLVVEFAFLFLAMIISFLISRVLPGDPVLPYLPSGSVSPELYDAVRHMLGLDQPIIEQFFRYIGDMLTGAWGFSFSISRGYPVFSLIMERIPPTIYLLVLPLILGLFLGFILGNHSVKDKSIIGNRTVQIVSLLGFALPIITLAILFQFFLSFINPLFDLVLLWIALSISITALTTLLVRIYLINLTKEASEKHSTIAFILLVGFSYGIVLAFLIQTEIMFSFEGIGDLFLQAISSADYYVMNVIIFLTLISFPIFIMLSLFLFFLFGKVKNHYILRQTNITQLNTNINTVDNNNTEFHNSNSTRENSN
jgi:ABC-type dipeptide/oligopeptide/nickel transport system permease component